SSNSTSGDTNCNSQEALDFTVAAIEALENGDEVDWEEDFFEYRINDANLRPCMKSILINLTNLTTGVGHIVTTFAGNTPGYNWEVKDGSLNGQTGSTSTHYNTSTGTATTTFDSQAWPDATDLSWARTILHESVHAYVVAVTYNNS